jgi:outer membrane receptor protein involved in Fe transport
VNTWRIFLPRTDRIQFATFVDHPVTDRLDFFGDLMFYKAQSTGGYEPINFNTADMVDGEVPADNPWNPFGSRFYHPTGAPNSDGTPRLVGTPAVLRIPTAVRLNEWKPRIFNVYSYAYRTLAGVRGKLPGDWEWESAFLYSGAQTHEYDHNTVRESWLRQALGRTDTNAYNPFGYTFKIVDNQIRVAAPYRNPDSLLDSLYYTAQRFGRTGLFVWDAKANGRLWQLFNGGRIGAATGAEVRYETYKDGRPGYDGINPPGTANPPFLREGDNDIINSSANVPISAAQTIYAVYSELAFPFITRENRKPLVDGLELTLAGRFEHFSIHGQSTTPKTSLVWQPARWLKLRGSYNESFRAPNLAQTSSKPIRRQASSTDYYRYEVTGLPDDAAHPRLTLYQGNENLKPEKAKSWVVGFVVDVPKVRGLSVTFDYWRINQNDAFSNEGPGAAMQLDQLYLDLATQAALAKGTPIDQVDLGSGTPSYKGYKVERLPVTDTDRALFAAYNARQTNNAAKRAPVGQFVSVVSQFINLGGRDLEGYELAFQYRLPRTRIGQFTLKGESTHYLRRQEQADTGSPVLSTLGKDGSVRWRANASLTWRQGAWSVGWFTNYIGSFVDTSAATTEAVYRALGGPDYISVFNDNGIVRYLYRVKPFILHNANLAYRFESDASAKWLRGTTVRLGVNNLFDTEPPIVDEANAYAGGAHVRGRQFTLDISKAF